MAERILMLALSPTMEKGIISRWAVQEGDVVSEGDLLCEVETDKTAMDFNVPRNGTVLRLLVAEGKEAVIGQTIAILGRPGEDISALLPSETPSPAAPSAAPKPAPSTSDSAPPPSEPILPGRPSEPVHPGQAISSGRVKASPLARRLARERGLDLAGIHGSGPRGRVVRADLEALHLRGEPVPVSSPLPGPLPPGDERVPVSSVRRVVAQRLSESYHTAPHYFLKVTPEVEALLSARERINAGRSERISLNAFLLKLVAEALKRHPAVNSTWEGETILRHARADIGLAVAQPDGLIAPIVRDVGTKGVSRVEAELRPLIEKAQSGRLMPEEYSGATFTLSNLGSYGIDEFTAIINPPGAAILAVGAVRTEARFKSGGSLYPARVMTLTLSCDHRLLDGAVAAAFLHDLSAMLEDPFLALL